MRLNSFISCLLLPLSLFGDNRVFHKWKNSVDSTEFVEKNYCIRANSLLCKKSAQKRSLIDTNSCFSDLFDSLNALNSLKVLFHLGKTPISRWIPDPISLSHYLNLLFIVNAKMHHPSIQWLVWSLLVRMVDIATMISRHCRCCSRLADLMSVFRTEL